MTNKKEFAIIPLKIKDFIWYKDCKVVSLALHCMLNADENGSFDTSLNKMSEETGISKQGIRTSLKKLELTHFLTHKSTQSKTNIRLLNEEYYCAHKKNQHTNQHTNQHSKKRERNHKVASEDSVKADKIIKKIPEAFEIYRDVFHYGLNPAQKAEVEKVVPEGSDLVLWREILTEWALRGWNPKNLRGMLECFKEGRIGDKSLAVSKERQFRPFQE